MPITHYALNIFRNHANLYSNPAFLPVGIRMITTTVLLHASIPRLHRPRPFVISKNHAARANGALR